MKVTLDLSRLLHEGKITQAEYARLSALAAETTGSLGFNILIGFGVIAVSAGAMALVPQPESAVALGILVGMVGLGLSITRAQAWMVLANICIVVGALLFAGGVVVIGKGSIESLALVAVLFAVGGVVAQSGLLIVASVLALSSCIGTRTGYLHAAYFLGVEEPTITILLFSLIAFATYHLSKQLSYAYEHLALMAARTSIFLVNFGFWVGSLWGDRLMMLRRVGGLNVPGTMPERVIQRPVFAVVWALALILTAAWAVKANRRWTVNICAVFGAIHFYTQWFEHFGARPLGILLAGLLALAIAIALWHFNRWLATRKPSR
jgi:iron complex transport system permease protein